MATFWPLIGMVLSDIGKQLQNQRSVGIAVLVSGTLAGLYGYQFLGRRSGFLRQLIVALPGGVLFGLIALFIDYQAGFAYSDALQSLFTLSNREIGPYLFAILAFASVALETVADPNAFSIEPVRLPRWRSLLIFLLLTIDVMLLSAVVMRVNIDKLDVVHGIKPSNPALLGSSFIFAIAFVAFTSWLERAQNQASASAKGERSWKADVKVYALAIAAAGTALGIGAMVFLYVIVLMGWYIFVYFGLFVATFLLLYATQRYVDAADSDEDVDKHTGEWYRGVTDDIRQSQKVKQAPSIKLVYVSLFWFLVAVVLQLYQILAFTPQH